MRLESRYGEYFPEYANYFVRPFRINKSMYRMNNNEKLFSDELTNWQIYESGFNLSKCQMSIYYKYAPDGSKLVMLYYVDECIYWYTSEELVKWFVDTLGKRYHMNYIRYTHWFMSISMSQLKEN